MEQPIWEAAANAASFNAEALASLPKLSGSFADDYAQLCAHVGCTAHPSIQRCVADAEERDKAAQLEAQRADTPSGSKSGKKSKGKSNGAAAPVLAALTVRDTVLDAATCSIVTVLLPRTERLGRLSLCNVGLRPSGLQQLGGALLSSSSPVRHLQVDFNPLAGEGEDTDEASVHFADLLGSGCRLETASLRGNGIGPAGAAAIARALGEEGGPPALAALSLHGNRVGASGAAAILGAVPTCAALRELSLSGNLVGWDADGDAPDALLAAVHAALDRPLGEEEVAAKELPVEGPEAARDAWRSDLTQAAGSNAKALAKVDKELDSKVSVLRDRMEREGVYHDGTAYFRRGSASLLALDLSRFGAGNAFPPAAMRAALREMVAAGQRASRMGWRAAPESSDGAKAGADSAPATSDPSWPQLKKMELRNALHVPGADHTARYARWDDEEFAAHVEASVQEVRQWTGVEVKWTP